MSRVTELLDYANRLGRQKIEDRRYEEGQALQMVQIAAQKDKENKIIESKRALNDIVKPYLTSGWKNGVWQGAPPVDSNEILNQYMTKMDNLGLAGDPAVAIQTLDAFKNKYYQDASQTLSKKMAAWEIANKDKHGEWYVPFDDTYAEEKKEYLKEIGADKLYSDLFGSVGQAKTFEVTGLSPDSFGKKEGFIEEHPVLTGIGAITAATLAYKLGPKGYKSLVGAIKGFSKNPPKSADTIKQLYPKVDDAIKPVFDKIIRLQNTGQTKAAERLIAHFKDRIPGIGASSIKTPTTPPKTRGGIIAAGKALFKGDKAGMTKALKSSGYAKYALGMAGGGLLAEKIADWAGADEATQTVASVGGSIAGGLSANKVMKAMTSPKVLKVLSKHAPKIAAKIGISATGFVGPQALEPISTALGVAGTVWAAYDIYQIAKEVPEVYNAIMTA